MEIFVILLPCVTFQIHLVQLTTSKKLLVISGTQCRYAAGKDRRSIFEMNVRILNQVCNLCLHLILNSKAKLFSNWIGKNAVEDPRYLWQRPHTPKWGAPTYYFGNFPENCMKLKWKLHREEAAENVRASTFPAQYIVFRFHAVFGNRRLVSATLEVSWNTRS